MKQYIPEDLQLEELLDVYPPTEIEKFSIDRLIHCMHLIFSIPANNKDLEIIKGYVPINSDILRARIPNYKSYLCYLERTGVIECNNHYIVGERSKGYRFQKMYCTGLKAVEIHDKTLINHQRADSYFSASMKKAYNYLMKWFDDDLEIDYDLAMDYIQTDRNRKKADRALWDKDLSKGTPKLPWNQYYSSYINIQRIVDKDFYTSVDTNVYRFHSNLTNIRSELRNCLTYNGNSLVAIDITNSQPYISTALLKRGFWGDDSIYKGIQISDIRHNTTKAMIEMDRIQSFFSSIMSQESGESLDGQDLQRYADLVTQGKFYEFLSRVMGDELGASYKSRKEVKGAIFQVLFTSNQFISQLEAAPKRLFRDLFPNVYKLLSIIKSRDKTTLPRLLQRIESELVLRRVGKRIARERPKLPIFTVHDSIATTMGNEDYVKNIMCEELYEAIGHLPVLKVENWHPTEMRFNDNKLYIGEEEVKIA